MPQPSADRRSDKPRAGLRLMHVHAHPDDESSKGAASTAKYVAEGVDVHVVTCTGGERGSVLNAKMDRPEVWENITEIRREEMHRARDILGIRQDWLGFIDSGWPEGDPPPPLPEGCFALVPLEESTERLVRLIREFRPHVLTTYYERGGYPHPDHIRCHEVSVAAYHAAGDPERFPDPGPFPPRAHALLPAAPLRQAIRRTLFAAATGPGHFRDYLLQGLLCEVGADRLWLVASDNRRLAVAEVPLLAGGSTERTRRVLLSVKTLDLLADTGAEAR